MPRIFLLCCFILLTLPGLRAQKTTVHDFPAEDLAFLKIMGDSIANLAFVVQTDSVSEERYLAVHALIPRLVKALKTPNSFHYRFPQVQHMSIQYPADSSFRIFTIELFVNRDEYRYFGAIQFAGSELNLIPLVDRSGEFAGDLTTARLTPDDWYGNLIYRIQEVKEGPHPYYLLYGIDSYSAYRRRKLVDVLRFDRHGMPVLGAPVFVDDKGGVKSRLLQEYSADASVRLNYDEVQELIMTDHLETMGGQVGQGPVNVPDGTYEGYRLDGDGKWHYVDKVFHHVYDEAPRPQPRTEGKGTSIIGRKSGRR
ncbi:MAG: hypothetical protein WBA17_01850 [Saprospiraceae bacterium]